MTAIVSARRAAYRAQQLGVFLPCFAGQQFLRLLLGTRAEPPEHAARDVRDRYRALMRRDLRNVEQGLYPESLLFQMPIIDYLRRAPALALDVPRAMRRMKNNDFRDLPDDLDRGRFPAYFLRNFHWQTDGYLSRRSAAIYDLGVEFLFLGTADVMRRQIIPPITRMIRAEGDRLRLLDVGCGTGRALLQIARAHPRLSLYGLDLSPWYLQEARETLAAVPDVSLVADNAERMPFRDGSFDVVTSVHLFHELPPAARRNAYAEMWRVLRPGGLCIIEDSAQLSDGETLGYFLERFSREFHEPFHASYMREDIAAALTAHGFHVESSEVHFVAKVVVARKPGDPALAA
jgi:ubiquinone/menaquinone biosynthesis C-methylase UbiE